MTPAAFAILDTNNNGLSDFWERDFNNGTLFDEFFDPQADSDADGWTNAQEATAGTNPFVPNPPDGMIRPVTGHIPAVWSEPDEFNEIYLIRPETVTVTWPTLAGKQYTLLFSPDLTEESWLPVGDPFVANGGETTYGFAISQADKCFWRVSVEDIDADSDGLTDHEEFLAGTNPTFTDTDSDTLSDHAELIAGTDPLQADADGDGWTDPQELAAGTDSRKQDSDGDGIPDSIDSDPLVSALAFADTDGDGIPDGDDANPNDPRGPAPSIASETASGNPVSNLIKDDTARFVLTVSNPGGPAPTASNLTFYLNGAEENATITVIGAPVASSQRFLLTWAAKTTANYPTLTLQNLTLRFRDSQQATSWLKLARIDVAEWEGMIASLRSGTGAYIPTLQAFSHFSGNKSRSSYTMGPHRSVAGWYRGPREIAFVNDSSGSTLLTAQIQGTMRYPLFLISASPQGLPVLDRTISISDAATYTHRGYLIVNDCSTDIRMELTPGGSATISSGNQGYLAQPEPDDGGPFIASRKMHYKKDGNWVLFQEAVIALTQATGSTRDYIAGRFYPSAATEGFSRAWMDFQAPVEAHIIPHAAGTFEYPGLPIPCEFHTGTTHPALLPITAEQWHKIILKAGPDAAALSNGIGLWLRMGEHGDEAPQTGIMLKTLGDNEALEDLTVPADGKITFAENSPKWQRLTSPEGLTVFMSRDENLTDTHVLSLQLLKKQEWYAQEAVRIVSIDILPCDVAVDANRDGEITFDGNDKTTAANPFRFWINNDQDNVEIDEPIDVTQPDSLGAYISTKRDLEDFCRLRVKIGIDNAKLRAADYQIGLKFSGNNPGTPYIRCWENQSLDGDTSYLINAEAAGRQKALSWFIRSYDTGISMIPPSYWSKRTDSTADIIFEGVEKGLGELVVTIHDKNGVLLGESGEAWIKLMDVREMYQRAKVTKAAEEIPEPWVNDNPDPLQWEWTENGHPYIEDPQAEPLACIFVHGWRMPYAESLSWADTSYKRLWQQGYKGKFYAFRWATFSGDDSPFLAGRTTYNPSEYRAWLCGPALADFVNALPQASRQKRLFAHSMGNVISGAALRAGMVIEQYSLCNAAMSASAYDTNPALRKDQAGNDLTWIGNRETPDTDPDPAYRVAFGLQDKFNQASFPRMFNFGLPNDSALGVWTVNNFQWKPEEALGYYYSLPPYQRPTCFNRVVTSLPEAMAYVTKSLTRTAGADLRTQGIITNSHSMSSWTTVGTNHGGFGTEHSAQWAWNYQSTNLFWKLLIETLELK